MKTTNTFYNSEPWKVDSDFSDEDSTILIENEFDPKK